MLLPWLQACAAYCFITIPSLSNTLERLNLYLLSGRVAVANGALTQGVVIVMVISMLYCQWYQVMHFSRLQYLQ